MRDAAKPTHSVDARLEMGMALPELRSMPASKLPNVASVTYSTVESGDFENRGPSEHPLFRKLTPEQFGQAEREKIDRWFKVFLLHGAGLNHLGTPHWSELTFSTKEVGGSFADVDEASTRVFHDGVSEDPSYRHIIRRLSSLAASKVFIQSPLGHPETVFMWSLYKRSRVREAFLIQLYGRQAPVTCSCCAERYLTQPVASGAHQIGPFHDCKVLKLGNYAVGDARCGNCHVLNLHCTYTSVRFWVMDADSTGNARSALTGEAKSQSRSVTEGCEDVEPHLTSLLENAPRITSELPGVGLSDEERKAAVERARARITQILQTDQDDVANEGIVTKVRIGR